LRRIITPSLCLVEVALLIGADRSKGDAEPAAAIDALQLAGDKQAPDVARAVVEQAAVKALGAVSPSS
jgi:hypothetical protein